MVLNQLVMFLDAFELGDMQDTFHIVDTFHILDIFVVGLGVDMQDMFHMVEVFHILLV